MHETVFIDSIIKSIKNPDEVKEIFLEVGELAGIEAEHLKEHLQKRKKWKVNVETIQSQVECMCGYRGRAKINERLHDLVLYSCPKCEGIPNEVIEGDNIKVKKVVYL